MENRERYKFDRKGTIRKKTTFIKNDKSYNIISGQ